MKNIHDIIIQGSPPRMRGTVNFGGLDFRRVRITPADAGNRPGLSKSYDGRRDHPRGCGEQYWLAMLTKYHLGSPPRMRGTGDDAEHHARVQGITPADAGNSIVFGISAT